jgi:hypothetical protein
MTDAEVSLPARVGLWAAMIAFGPLHFGGEMVGPSGATDWRQWAAALVGSVLWAALIVEVVGL